MMRDPNYKKNEKRFFGLPSHATVQRSASSVHSNVQRLDQFITKNWLIYYKDLEFMNKFKLIN